jgi:alkaline phosphatase
LGPATTAGFVSHNIGRFNYPQIADEIVFSTRPDVVIGGGHPDFGSGFGYLSEAAYAELRASPDWVLAERAPGGNGGATLLTMAHAAVTEHKKLFGLFGGPPRGGFEPPLPVHDPGHPAFTGASRENPTLAEAVWAALTVLSTDENGLFLLVEQGDLDWANHANDYAWMVGAVYDLDMAVQAATQFVDRDGDAVDWSNTLVIVTSDHANSYMRLDAEHRLGRGELPDDLSEYVTYGSGSHTNELVMLYARGGGVSETEAGPFAPYEGAWYPSLRVIDNTHIFQVMADFLGITAQ